MSLHGQPCSSSCTWSRHVPAVLIVYAHTGLSVTVQQPGWAVRTLECLFLPLLIHLAV